MCSYFCNNKALRQKLVDCPQFERSSYELWEMRRLARRCYAKVPHSFPIIGVSLFLPIAAEFVDSGVIRVSLHLAAVLLLLVWFCISGLGLCKRRPVVGSDEWIEYTVSLKRDIEDLSFESRTLHTFVRNSDLHSFSTQSLKLIDQRLENIWQRRTILEKEVASILDDIERCK